MQLHPGPLSRLRHLIPKLDGSQWTALAVPTCLSAVMVIVMLAQPHMLVGVRGLEGAGYDDGAYLATSLRLSQFSFPYRDYLFLHPPGITYLLAPLNVVSVLFSQQMALVAARVITAGLVVANVALVGLLLRHRGPWAMAVGGFALALWPLTSFVSTTLMIEPYVGFFLLAGCLAVFRGDDVVTGRRLRLGGALLGMALALKVVAVVPIAVLVGVCIWKVRGKAIAFVEGMALTFAVAVLPFVMLAPFDAFRDVVVTQMQREAATPWVISTEARLETIFGLTSSPARGDEGILAVTLFVAVLSVAAITSVLRWGRWTPLDVFVGLGWLACVGFLLRTPDVFNQYPYPATILCALLLGTCSGEVVDRIGRSKNLVERQSLRRAATGLGVAVVGAAVLLVGVPRSFQQFESLESGALDPSGWIRTIIPEGSCVVFDVPTLAVVSNRLLATRECPDLIDPFGMWLGSEEQSPPGRASTKPPSLVREWARFLDQADFVVLSVDYSNYIPWTPELRSQFRQDFRRVEDRSGIVVYQRTTAERTRQ